jgi:hypothetical protein
MNMEKKITRFESQSKGRQWRLWYADQKYTENVESFNYLGSMITNDARCTREIKSKIDMEN